MTEYQPTRKEVLKGMVKKPVVWLDLGGITLFSYLMVILVPKGNPLMVVMVAVGIVLLCLSFWCMYEMLKLEILMIRKIEKMDKLSKDMTVLMRKMSGTLDQTYALSNDDFQ
jgi:hypothetical protein